MANRVVVHDIGQLETYCATLTRKKEEMERHATDLTNFANSLQQTASETSTATNAQSSNWQDPQYDKLKDELTPVISGMNSTAESMKETAGAIKAQMQQVEESIGYIKTLIAKLKAM